MLEEFKSHISKEFPHLFSSKVLLAVSGGVDSMTMMSLFNSLKLNFSVAHCNFQLRGEDSNRDESFVIEESKKIGVSHFTKKFNTAEYSERFRISIQMAARELRYAWFEEIRKRENIDYIITAHHLDDELETFFINLSRGSGIKGLIGIPPRNGRIIRPMLPFTKQDILLFAEINKVCSMEDSTNNTNKYSRNFFRREVIPPIKKYCPNFLSFFSNTLAYLKDTHSIFQQKLSDVKNDILEIEGEITKINIEKLKKTGLASTYLHHILSEYGFSQISDIAESINGISGSVFYSSTHRLLRDREYFILTEISDIDNDNYFINENETILIKPISAVIEITDQIKILNNKDIAQLDLDKLSFPLILRRWELGDRFIPLGMRSSKKLSKFFKDEKLSILDKENIWVLCSDRDIVWVVGHRISNNYKITSHTHRVYQIELKNVD
ncbi:tRNA lysidine(34) synthetase TilS [Ichthyobacterium seriolicida]|uniref:tRNA(Ile)-lysidine synthase n=1 Tax=Ichthyobacterium seriolicida TaxID=242600 RepID=A0A1J1DZF7_9FLAO|nr:tRNA lysidine(34) synthetase TilS [Ichthyobacterium seriolicida]BAV95273.1 tRNA(Ile)-lysidine synthetase [Ichthyobacterium seriolicida]